MIDQNILLEQLNIVGALLLTYNVTEAFENFFISYDSNFKFLRFVQMDKRNVKSDQRNGLKQHKLEFHFQHLILLFSCTAEVKRYLNVLSVLRLYCFIFKRITLWSANLGWRLILTWKRRILIKLLFHKSLLQNPILNMCCIHHLQIQHSQLAPTENFFKKSVNIVFMHPLGLSIVQNIKNP